MNTGGAITRWCYPVVCRVGTGESTRRTTAKFENGKIIYGFDFVNDVTDAGSNSVDYSINQLGYIS